MGGPKIPEGATKTDLSLLARVTGGLRGLRAGFQGEFNPPGEPQDVSAPRGTRTRLFDYSPYRNQQVTPRAYEGISFADLRSLADNCDLVRLAIEEVKDQQSRVKWSFRIRPEHGEDPQAYEKRNSTDARVAKLNLMFRYPDRFHTFAEWQRMLLEDMLVIDAVCIEPRFTEGDELAGLDLIDGATIVRLIDGTGRTPVGTMPAYQQIVHGQVAVEMTTRELMYVMRNPRTSHVYGFSPVEQIIMTVNQALRRAMFQLNHYTEGNIGTGFIPVPETWNLDDVKEMQAYWDIMVTGKPSEQAKMHFIPYGQAPIFPQNEVLKDEFDEWLARIISKAFKVSPDALLKSQNRATSEASREAAGEDGLMVRTGFMKDLLENAIVRWTEWEDIEAIPEYGRGLDQLKQAQTDEIYVRSGVYSVDEVRQALGKQPIGVGHGVLNAQGFIPFHKLTDVEGKMGALPPQPDPNSTDNPLKNAAASKPKPQVRKAVLIPLRNGKSIEAWDDQVVRTQRGMVEVASLTGADKLIATDLSTEE